MQATAQQQRILSPRERPPSSRPSAQAKKVTTTGSLTPSATARTAGLASTPRGLAEVPPGGHARVCSDLTPRRSPRQAAAGASPRNHGRAASDVTRPPEGVERAAAARAQAAGRSTHGRSASDVTRPPDAEEQAAARAQAASRSHARSASDVTRPPDAEAPMLFAEWLTRISGKVSSRPVERRLLRRQTEERMSGPAPTRPVDGPLTSTAHDAAAAVVAAATLRAAADGGAGRAGPASPAAAAAAAGRALSTPTQRRIDPISWHLAAGEEEAAPGGGAASNASASAGAGDAAAARTPPRRLASADIDTRTLARSASAARCGTGRGASAWGGSGGGGSGGGGGSHEPVSWRPAATARHQAADHRRGTEFAAIARTPHETSMSSASQWEASRPTAAELVGGGRGGAPSGAVGRGEGAAAGAAGAAGGGAAAAAAADASRPGWGRVSAVWRAMTSGEGGGSEAGGGERGGGAAVDMAAGKATSHAGADPISWTPRPATASGASAGRVERRLDTLETGLPRRRMHPGMQPPP